VKLIKWKKLPHTRDALRSRPYLILNNYPRIRNKRFFALNFVWRLYKLHRRMFKRIKKKSYRRRKWLRIWFKLLSSKPFKKSKNIMQKRRHKMTHLHLSPLRKNRLFRTVRFFHQTVLANFNLLPNPNYFLKKTSLKKKKNNVKRFS